MPRVNLLKSHLRQKSSLYFAIMVKLLSLVGSALAAPGFKSERYDLNAPRVIGGSEVCPKTSKIDENKF